MDHTFQPLILEPDAEKTLQKSYPHNKAEISVQDETVEPGSLEDVLYWLARPPMYTTLRVNTVATSTQTSMELVKTQLQQQCSERGISNFMVDVHPQISDCLVIHNRGPHWPLEKSELEVIVDVPCGMAVLRGADVFKQGILGAPLNMEVGSTVAVYADLDGKCLRGCTQVYQGKKLYVGTGQAQISRSDLFCVQANTLKGVGIVMSSALYQAPSLADMLPEMVFPQNLPSIVCGHVLNPLPGQTVIDLCAAPGGKTTHLACLMKNEGRLVALDKTEDKIAKITNSADVMGLTCIEAYAFDARKAVSDDADVSGGPPYPPDSFDAVLLDGPCSALGQRPSARNRMSASSLASFPKLQRMLLATAVSLVRPGGVLVYSTCTVTVEENEEQVAWLLRTFPQMELQPQLPHIGRSGFPHMSLSAEECRLVQRFDPSGLHHCSHSCDVDTIGFFIAKFRKK